MELVEQLLCALLVLVLEQALQSLDARVVRHKLVVPQETQELLLVFLSRLLHRLGVRRLGPPLLKCCIFFLFPSGRVI